MEKLFASLLFAVLLPTLLGQQLSFLPFIDLGSNVQIFNESNNNNVGLKLESTFRYGEESHYRVWIATDGLISVGENYKNRTGHQFPVPQRVIAPYWDNLDMLIQGQVEYKVFYASALEQVNASALEQVNTYINEQTNISFQASWVMVAKWVDACSRGDSQCINESMNLSTFQAVIATDGIRSFSVFTYLCGMLNTLLTKSTTPASIGFSAGPDFFQNHPLSLSENVNDIACLNTPATNWSNVFYTISRVVIIADAQQYAEIGFSFYLNISLSPPFGPEYIQWTFLPKKSNSTDDPVIIVEASSSWYELSEDRLSLLIFNFSSDAEGNYTVFVNDTLVPNSKTISLDTLIFPNITSISNSQTASFRTNVSFTCTATGNPLPDIQWIRESLPVDSITEPSDAYPSPVTSTVELSNVILEDSGVYICNATNKFNHSSSQELSLSVVCNGSNICIHGSPEGSNCTCSCDAGYTGSVCDQDIDECEGNRCDNGATCNDQIASYTCTCAAGFTDELCTTNVDDCSLEPCENGGKCIDEIDSYTCQCVQGYTGNNCQTDIDECSPNPCNNGGTCFDGINSYSCQCIQGYTGNTCQTNIDDCSPNLCNNGGTCVDGIDSYSCQCVQGYTGDTCETNINDCITEPCENGGTCTDEIDSYTCQCVQGYTGNNCQTDIDDCSPNPCNNGGNCVDGIDSYSCQCVQGYAGDTCQTDIRNCSFVPCNNNGTCTDGIDSYTCQCVQGFAGDTCEMNVDDCIPEPCNNGGTCMDLINNFECICPPRYTGQNCTVKIDECRPGDCLNGGFCTDQIVGFSCQCVGRWSGPTCANCTINNCISPVCNGKKSYCMECVEDGYTMYKGSCVPCNISSCKVCSEENVCRQCAGDLELSADGNECAALLEALVPESGLSLGVIVAIVIVALLLVLTIITFIVIVIFIALYKITNGSGEYRVKEDAEASKAKLEDEEVESVESF